MSSTGESCETCGKPLHSKSPDSTYCSEMCQSVWTRNYWNLPSAADEVRNGLTRRFGYID